MTSAALITAVGTALFGERFDRALGEALHVNDRTVRRWRNGDTEPQEGVWRDVFNLVMTRRHDLAMLTIELGKRL